MTDAQAKQIPQIISDGSGDLIDARTGEVLTVDAIVARFELLNIWIGDMIRMKKLITEHFRLKANIQTGRTGRVKGETRAVKVNLPADSWDNAGLKRLYKNTPKELRDSLLRVEKVAVQMKEFKKVANSATENEREREFWEAITRCNEGQTGSARIEIEA